MMPITREDVRDIVRVVRPWLGAHLTAAYIWASLAASGWPWYACLACGVLSVTVLLTLLHDDIEADEARGE